MIHRLIHCTLIHCNKNAEQWSIAPSLARWSNACNIHRAFTCSRIQRIHRAFTCSLINRFTCSIIHRFRHTSLLHLLCLINDEIRWLWNSSKLPHTYHLFIFWVLSQFYFKHPARGTRKTRVFKTFHIPSNCLTSSSQSLYWWIDMKS